MGRRITSVFLVLFSWISAFCMGFRLNHASMSIFRNSHILRQSQFRLKSGEKDTSVAEVQVPDDPRVVAIDLNEELKTSFMSYAMSTILSRALPDARDGLKPVHRRVLYAMQCLNHTPDSSYRKCARVVGEVLGKFHPHGDQSVYDALVRMAQDFVMLHPLVAGHGNFGSVDNDPPAAMRLIIPTQRRHTLLPCKIPTQCRHTLLPCKT